MKIFLFLLVLVFSGVNAQTKQQEGVEVKKSRLLLLPASMVESSAATEYQRLLDAASRKNLLNRDPAQFERLRTIAHALTAHSQRFNASAVKWKWEVNLISSKAVNAFCMPGGKIAFFSGIIDQLQLTDDEIATIMGHEIGHALLEHGRARMTGEFLKAAGVTAVAIYFNLGQISGELLAQAANLAVSLPYARRQEADADLVGLELAARAGYDPRAAVAVWHKMARLSKSGAKDARGQPPQFLSTHPSHENRIREIEANLPKVLPLYRKAKP